MHLRCIYARWAATSHLLATSYNCFEVAKSLFQTGEKLILNKGRISKLGKILFQDKAVNSNWPGIQFLALFFLMKLISFCIKDPILPDSMLFTKDSAD